MDKREEMEEKVKDKGRKATWAPKAKWKKKHQKEVNQMQRMMHKMSFIKWNVSKILDSSLTTFHLTHS